VVEVSRYASGSMVVGQKYEELSQVPDEIVIIEPKPEMLPVVVNWLVNRKGLKPNRSVIS